MLVDPVSCSAGNEPRDTEQPGVPLQQDFITCMKGGVNTHWSTSSISKFCSAAEGTCAGLSLYVRFGVNVVFWILFRQQSHSAEVRHVGFASRPISAHTL